MPSEASREDKFHSPFQSLLPFQDLLSYHHPKHQRCADICCRSKFGLMFWACLTSHLRSKVSTCLGAVLGVPAWPGFPKPPNCKVLVGGCLRCVLQASLWLCRALPQLGNRCELDKDDEELLVELLED